MSASLNVNSAEFSTAITYVKTEFGRKRDDGVKICRVERLVVHLDSFKSCVSHDNQDRDNFGVERWKIRATIKRELEI